MAFVGIPAFITPLPACSCSAALTWQVLHNLSLSSFPEQYQQHRQRVLSTVWLGGNGYDVFTLVIFAIGVAGYVFGQVRARRRAIAYKQPVAALPLFISSWSRSALW